MTDIDPQSIQELSPDKLMTRFTKSSLMLAVMIALALHVLVLVPTSIDDIHGWIDPSFKEQLDLRRQQAEQRAAEESLAKMKARLRIPAAAATQPAASRPAGSQPAGDEPGTRKLPKAAKPKELPKAPGGGITIGDTEGR